MYERNTSIDDRIETLFNKLSRALDERAESIGEKEGVRHRQCRQFLRGGYNCWELWKRAARGTKQ